MPAGNVISTDPKEGETLAEIMKVVLLISLGKETGTMPDLVSRKTTLTAAKVKMESYRFTNVQYVPVNSTLEAGTVVSQSVAAGSTVTLDCRIVIEYSNGIPPDIPPVTKVVDLELPLSEEDYLLTVVVDGKIQLLDYVVNAGQTSCSLELTGIDMVECKLYINGILYKTVIVDLVADEQT